MDLKITLTENAKEEGLLLERLRALSSQRYKAFGHRVLSEFKGDETKYPRLIILLSTRIHTMLDHILNLLCFQQVRCSLEF